MVSILHKKRHRDMTSSYNCVLYVSKKSLSCMYTKATNYDKRGNLDGTSNLNIILSYHKIICIMCSKLNSCMKPNPYQISFASDIKKNPSQILTLGLYWINSKLSTQLTRVIIMFQVWFNYFPFTLRGHFLDHTSPPSLD